MFDTDGDRQLDGAESACGSDPLDPLSRVLANAADPDLEGDFLPAACEAVAGSDPALNDTDADGILDGVEFLRVGTSALDSNSDDDDCSDADEIASLNPGTGVDSIDLGIVASRFGLSTSPLYFWDFDMNRDGSVSSIDLLFVALQFGACT
jgi:hypothetical protein